MTQLEITNETLPLIEKFQVNAGVGENRAPYFFSPDYKALNSETPQTVTDSDGNELVLEDGYPAFYYPTAGFWQVDPTTGEYTGEYIEDLDQRLFVGDGMLAVANARFTIGQLLTDLVKPKETASGDVKNGSTDYPADSSWGELDLSQPYRVSFCINDSGEAGVGIGNVEIFVDNNSGGRIDESIHGFNSLLLRTPTYNLTSGNRLVVDVPGNVRMVDDEGQQVGDVMGVVYEPVGTEHSFIQLRVSSGGYVVLSDLVVEVQTEDNAAEMVCDVNEDFFSGEVPQPTGTPFTGLPLEVDFSNGRDAFLPDADTMAAETLTISSDNTNPFYKVISSSTRIFIEDSMLRFGNAFWTAGLVEGTTSSLDEWVNGDMNLSVPYTVRVDIAGLPTFGDGNDGFQVMVDNATSSSANSIHGSASRLINLHSGNGLDVGQLVVNVPGNVYMNDVHVATIANHVGTSSSFLGFRCPSNCGSASDIEGGITISDITVEYQSIE